MTERPSRDELLMETAELWAKRSTCIKPNGAVIAREARIISIGYNGSPPGQDHCLDSGCMLDDDGRCIRTIHAEANSIAWAARNGVSTRGSSLYCTTSPCLVCAKLIITAGILEVYYREPYSNPQGLELLRESGVVAYHVPR